MTITTRIKPRQLELFVKIAETGQLQLAAQYVALSQPAASRSLQELETLTGSRLFVRQPTGMELTQAGRMFLRHARVVLSELGAMESELEGLRSGQLGKVKVGSVTGPAVGRLMPAVQAMYDTAPELRITVDVAPSSVLFRGLEEARYDFILGRADPRYAPNDFLFHPGRAEKIALMVHQSHPLAGEGMVPLERLAQFPWVIQEEGSPIRQAVEDTFLSHGTQVPARVLNSSSLLVALTHVLDGGAIAPQTNEVISLLLSDQIGAKLTTIPCPVPINVAPYFVIQDARRELSRAARQLLDEVLRRL